MAGRCLVTRSPTTCSLVRRGRDHSSNGLATATTGCCSDGVTSHRPRWTAALMTVEASLRRRQDARRARLTQTCLTNNNCRVRVPPLSGRRGWHGEGVLGRFLERSPLQEWRYDEPRGRCCGVPHAAEPRRVRSVRGRGQGDLRGDHREDALLQLPHHRGAAGSGDPARSKPRADGLLHPEDRVQRRSVAPSPRGATHDHGRRSELPDALPAHEERRRSAGARAAGRHACAGVRLPSRPRQGGRGAARRTTSSWAT